MSEHAEGGRVYCLLLGALLLCVMAILGSSSGICEVRVRRVALWG